MARHYAHEVRIGQFSNGTWWWRGVVTSILGVTMPQERPDLGLRGAGIATQTACVTRAMQWLDGHTDGPDCPACGPADESEEG